MNTQLLCTFAVRKTLTKTVDTIIETYDVLYNKIFVLKNANDNRELMFTYNIEKRPDTVILDNTISLHRKKLTNRLYTINALNELIRTVNNGVLDTTFQVEWDNYRNCILTTTEDGLKRIDTEVDEIIHIKVKR